MQWMDLITKMHAGGTHGYSMQSDGMSESFQHVESAVLLMNAQPCCLMLYLLRCAWFSSGRCVLVLIAVLIKDVVAGTCLPRPRVPRARALRPDL